MKLTSWGYKNANYRALVVDTQYRNHVTTMWPSFALLTASSPIWPMANLSLPLPPKSRPLANYSNVHSKSLNDLQSMVRITKNVQRPPPPSALIPKKCNSFEEIPGVNIVKTEKSFSN